MAQAPAPTSRSATVSLVGAVLALALLILWLAPLRSDPITVTFIRGSVTVEDENGNRTEVAPGTTLTPGDRLVIPGEGGATIELPDGHTVTVGDSTSATVDANDSNLLGRRRTIDMGISGGRLRISGEGAAGATLRLSTPTGVAGVRGTTLVVEVAPGVSRLSLQQGAADVAAPGGDPTPLDQGSGAVLTPTGVEVRPLPAAPQLLAPATGTVLLDAASARVAWTQVAGAAAYGVEMARDVTFREVLARVVVDGDTTAALPVLDEDQPVYVRVSARSPEGLEGPPSAERVLHVRLRLARGQALQAQERMAESIPEFLAALPNYSTDPRLLKDLAWSLYTVERLPEARGYYERALAEEPDDAEALLELGRVLFWLEDYDAAAARYQQVLDDAPGDADALWGLGDVYRAQGRTAEAEELLRRALAVDPNHPYAGESLRRLRQGG